MKWQEVCARWGGGSGTLGFYFQISDLFSKSPPRDFLPILVTAYFRSLKTSSFFFFKRGLLGVLLRAMFLCLTGGHPGRHGGLVPADGPPEHRPAGRHRVFESIKESSANRAKWLLRTGGGTERRRDGESTLQGS